MGPSRARRATLGRHGLGHEIVLVEVVHRLETLCLERLCLERLRLERLRLRPDLSRRNGRRRLSGQRPVERLDEMGGLGLRLVLGAVGPGPCFRLVLRRRRELC